MMIFTQHLKGVIKNLNQLFKPLMNFRNNSINHTLRMNECLFNV